MVGHFSYAARDNRGMKTQGEVIALSTEEAIGALQETGVYITQIKPIPVDGPRRGSGRVVLSVHERSILLESWSRLLDAGASMDEALFRLQAVSPHPSVSRALREIQRLIRDGMPLGDAVESSGLLPPSWAGIIEAGKERGDLLGPLMTLHRRSEQIRKTLQEVTSALLMPAVLITLVFVWVWIFTTRLLPVMASTVAEITGSGNSILMGLKGLTAMTFPVFVISVVLLGLLVLAVSRGNRSDSVMGGLPARLPVRFPLVGSLVAKLHLIVMASELEMQLEAGVPILTALTVLSHSMPRRSLRRELAGAYAQICAGTPVWQALGNLRVMPDRAMALLASGEACGKLPEMLGVLMREACLDLETQAQRLAIKVRSGSVIVAGIIIGVLVICLAVVVSSGLDTITQMTSSSAQLARSASL